MIALISKNRFKWILSKQESNVECMKYIFLNDHIKDAFFWDYSRMKEKRIKMPAFFWVTFQFQNEWNTILVIPPPKVQ